MSFLKKAKDKIVEETKEAGGKVKGSVQEGGVFHEAGEKVGAAGGKVKGSLKEGGSIHEGAEKVGGAFKKAGGKVAEETKEAAKKVKDKID